MEKGGTCIKKLKIHKTAVALPAHADTAEIFVRVN